MKTAAILLSRQKIYPSGACNWVKASIEAAKWVKNQNLTLFSSVGIQTWEFLLFLGTYFNINQCIIIPSPDQRSFLNTCGWIKDNFRLSNASVWFKALYSNEKANVSTIRDRFIVENANVIIPVSIRDAGEMALLINEAQLIGKTIVTDFQIKYERRDAPVKYFVHNENINNELDEINSRYLIHWTRSSKNAWPNESRDSYYSAVISSIEYPRDAFNTLKNIVTTRLLVGSSLHISKNQSVVCFSGSPLEQFIQLMRWRSRYKCMSFEPFGIGIEKEYALKLGVRPVIYTDKRDKSERYECWQVQTKGKIGDWEKENEYRYRGDLDLSIIPRNKMICLCLYTFQAEMIERISGIKAISIQPKKEKNFVASS
ncbi:MAG: hypothetical protein GX640_02550 [Fibrobacter sp.]|nr:hypothetical protein [Fibrobacter sp.]